MALSDPNTEGVVQDLVSVTAYVKYALDLKENVTQLPDFKVIEQSAQANASYWRTDLYPLYKKTAASILECAYFFL